MSTKPSSSKQTTEQGTAGQRAGTDKGIKFFEPLAYGQGDPMTGFTGDRLAGLTGSQEQAFGNVSGFLDQFAPQRDIPLYGEGADALRGILSGQTGAQSLSPDAVNSFFQGAVRDPAERAYQENVLPSIRESFAGPGFFNKERAVQQVKSRENLEAGLSEQRAGLEFDVLRQNQAIEEAKAGRALSGLSEARAFGQLPTQEGLARLQGTQAAYGLGSAEQQQNQAELNLALQEFQEANRDFDPETLNILMQLLNVGSTGTGTASQSGAGLGYTALAALAGGAGAGMGYGLTTP